MRPAYVVPFTLIAACFVPEEEAAKGGGATDTGDWTDDPPGCINIDGAGDFGTIAAAAAAAPEGASVYVCSGTWVLEEGEEIVIDRPMTIVGEDPDTTFVEPPVNQHGFEVSAAGVSISGFTVQNATRSGVALVDASDVTIDNMVFDGVGNWGVEAQDSTATISNTSFIEPQFGGVSVAGGAVSVVDSSFEQPYAYAVYAVNDAEVTLTGNTVTGTVAVVGDGSDGAAFFADGATLTTDGNVIDGADIYGIYAVDSVLTLGGDVIQTVIVGVLSVGSESATSATDLTITDAYYGGIAVQSPQPVTLDGVTISIAAGESYSESYETWGTDTGSIWGGAAIMFAADVTVKNATFSGYENYSLYISGYATSANATITDSTFQDSGRTGIQLWLDGGLATVSGVQVSGVRENEGESQCTGSVVPGSAMFLYSGTASISTSSFTDNVSWGISSYLSSVTVEGSSFSGNPCGAAIDLYGALFLTGNTFSSGGYWGTVHEELGALIAEGNTFVDTGDYTQTSSYTDETTGTVYSYEYDNSGRDIVLYEATEAEITENTFSNGDSALYSYNSAPVVTGNSFDGYARNIFYSSGGDATDPALFSDNTIASIGGYAVYANLGFVEVEDVVIDETLGYTSVSRSFENGVLSYESSYEYDEPVFAAYGYSYSYVDSTTGEIVVVEYPGGISLEGVSIGSAISTAVSSSGAQLDVDGLEIGTVGGYGVYGYWSEEIAQFHLSNVSIGSSVETAFYFEGGSGADGYPSLTDVSVDEVTDGGGIRARGLRSLTIDGASFGSTSSTGLSVSGDFEELVYDEEYGYYTYVTSTHATAVTATGLAIENADSDGIDFEDGVLTLTNSVVTSSTSDGLELSDATADIQGNTLTGNEGYGMTCDSVTLSACTGNDLSDNLLGPHDGCDDACGI